MIFVNEYSYNHLNLTNIDACYNVIYSYFSFCQTETYGGAIFCDCQTQTQSQSQNIKLNTILCVFYQCSAGKRGGSIYTNIPIKVSCSLINHCKLIEETQSHGMSLSTFGNASIDSCSSNFCSGYGATFEFFGKESIFQNSNESYQYAQYQCSGFGIEGYKCNVSFLTIAHIYDDDGCTLVFKCPEQSYVNYMNVFNSSSSQTSSHGLFLFSRGANIVISDSIFQINYHHSLIEYFEKNNKEIIIFRNCVFDTTIEFTFPSCETQNVQKSNNPTYITTLY